MGWDPKEAKFMMYF